MRTLGIVLAFPRSEKAYAVLDGNEAGDAVELVLIRAVATLDLAILLWPPDSRFPVGDAEVLQMPAELLGELRAVVRLHLFDGEWQRHFDLVNEVRSRLHAVVVVDAKDSVARAIVDGGEQYFLPPRPNLSRNLTSTCTRSPGLALA